MVPYDGYCWHSENLPTLRPGVPSVDLEGTRNPFICSFETQINGVSVLSHSQNYLYTFILYSCLFNQSKCSTTHTLFSMKIQDLVWPYKGYRFFSLHISTFYLQPQRKFNF